MSKSGSRTSRHWSWCWRGLPAIATFDRTSLSPQAINQFGRLNTRMHELEDEIKEKRSQHDQLDDAANELILADDDEPVRCATVAARLTSAPRQASR